MSREERLAYREKNGYMITELRELLREYFTIYEVYGLNRNNPYEIKLFDKTTNKDTDFSITMKSYSDDYFARDISLEWFKSWRDNERAYKKIEWDSYGNDYNLYDYFIVDHSIGYKEIIKKKDILGLILDFMIQYGDAVLSKQLSRELKLNKILNG